MGHLIITGIGVITLIYLLVVYFITNKHKHQKDL